MEGKVLNRLLDDRGFKNILIYEKENEESLEIFFEINKPEFVFLIGGVYGGIKANLEFPATLMIDSLLESIQVLTLSIKFDKPT